MIFLLLSMVGCISQEIPYREYDISIQVTNAIEGAQHTITILHEWFGEGDLRYPMYPLEEKTFSSDTLDSWTVLVEQGQGEGLVISIWEDTDGDKVFCSLDNREERIGLVVLDENEFVMDIEIELTHECMGFELLYSSMIEE
jgi:hypothetical protein